MKRLLPALLAVLVLALVLAGGVWLMRGRLAVAAMGRIYAKALGHDAIAELPDGLHVGLCGSGSPLPDPSRAGPCTVVIAGRRMFVVDAGEGSVRRLSLMGFQPGQASALFLTHYHSDHIADLGELMLQHWAGGAAAAPLPIYGPTGVDQVVQGFEAAYALDRGYRIAHHGPKVVPPAGFGGAPHGFAADRAAPDVVLIDEPDLKVIAFPVDHHPVEPAVGYLFVYKGHRVVVSGDTAPSARLEAAARGADVLVHEALAPNLVAVQRQEALKAHRDNLAAIFHDILSYHTTPEQAAAIAERDHVRYLLYTHLIPPLPSTALYPAFLGRSGEIFHGRIRVGEDGDLLSLPTGSQEIRLSHRLRTFQ
ncbi:MBL fold metallo-hydrolase [Caulobacter sp. KR2-114]|uniref:MBL fold metallo-hydrolase n=1 Tax=Caulobacter sp. KR2-114 TaxID=3400912 RepID=UPI003BFE88A5